MQSFFERGMGALNLNTIPSHRQHPCLVSLSLKCIGYKTASQTKYAPSIIESTSHAVSPFPHYNSHAPWFPMMPPISLMAPILRHPIATSPASCTDVHCHPAIMPPTHSMHTARNYSSFFSINLKQISKDSLHRLFISEIFF